MKTLEDLISELNEDELKQSFDELNRWRETGVLEEGIVRQVHAQYTSQQDTNYPIYRVQEPFLYVMASRYYQQ